MNLERYPLITGPTRAFFEFTSEGPKGSIPKIIRFTFLAAPNFYNLAFGDRIEGTEEMDDEAISNNGDSEKILATVVAAVFQFTEDHHEAVIFATGSTPARTRLYQMGIAKYFEMAQTEFFLYGRQDKTFEPSRKGVPYDAFLVTRRKAKFEV